MVTDLSPSHEIYKFAIFTIFLENLFKFVQHDVLNVTILTIFLEISYKFMNTKGNGFNILFIL